MRGAHRRGSADSYAIVGIAALTIAAAGATVSAQSEAGAGIASVPTATPSTYGRLATSFVENRGQAHSAARFLGVGGGVPIFFTDRDVRLVLARDSRRAALVLEFVGAHGMGAIYAEAPTGGVVNHLLGSDPRQWRSGLTTYGSIRYSNLWPGIDAVFRGGTESLKYEFVVRPGADPSTIRLRYRGAEAMRLTTTGDLSIDTEAGPLTDKAPATYQMLDGRRSTVESSYTMHDDGEYGFWVDVYDKSRPLVIDPGILYSTFLGGSSEDWGNAIAIDQHGNAYVAGLTKSVDFPVTPGSYDVAWGGGASGTPADAFVAKINAAGTAFVYVTYLGGFANDEALGIAVDASGSAYVTGYTEAADFPTTAGAFQTSKSAGRDAFVAKLNPAGSALVYATFLGGNATTTATGIAVDAAGSAHITGDTLATNLPTTAGAIQPPRVRAGRGDAFLIKFNPLGSGVSYGTYIGGRYEDFGTRIALDGSGYSYVAGITGSIDLRTSSNAVQPASNGDAFKSIDGGGTFVPINNGMRARHVTAFAIDPQLPDVIYAGTQQDGFFTSSDGGSSWRPINGGLTPPYAAIRDIAINPGAPATLVAASVAGIYKSVDSGNTWRRVFTPDVTRVAFARSNPQVLYAAYRYGGLKSVNGGESWSSVLQLTTSAVAVDPSDARIVYFGTETSGVWKSTDAGVTWTNANNGLPTFSRFITALGLNPASPQVLYAAVKDTSRFKSVNGGASWTATGSCCASDISRFTFDAIDSRVLYASGSSIDKTTDGGATWRTVAIRGNRIAVDGFAASGGTLFVGLFPNSDGFAYKIATAGGGDGLIYGTYIGGSSSEQARAIAVEANGNAVIVLNAYSADFPFTRPPADGFETAIVKLDPSGSRYVYASPLARVNRTLVDAVTVDGSGTAYAAGASDDTARHVWVERVDPVGLVSARVALSGAGFDGGHGPRGIAVDGAANVYLTGSTSTTRFPVSAGAPQRSYGGNGDAFITKLSFSDVGGVNVASGRTAVASSLEGPQYAAANAIDGNPGTRWSSQFSDPQWIYVDLGQRYHVDRVVLHWEAAFARFYEVQISDDTVNWTRLASASGAFGDHPSDGGTDNLFNLNGTGRYVRIYGTARATPWGYSLWEIEIYGTRVDSPPPPPDSTNLALNRPTWSSSNENAQLGPPSAVDGSGSTRWSSAFSDPQFIAIDLGRTIDVSRVVLRWERAYGADYRIEVSPDAFAWTTIRAVTGGDGGVDDLTGLSGSGRYIRMYGTRRGTPWGYSLWEFEVYGGTFPQTPTDIVMYASDVQDNELRGWFRTTDATSPNGVKLFTPDNGWSSTSAPPLLGDPNAKWVDFRFAAPQSGTYKIWLRLRATGDTKWNDSVWVQFSDATVNGAPAYRWGTQNALLVGLEDCSGCGVSGWGWQDGAWWLNQPTIVALPAASQTMRVLVREDGVQLDQIVLSPDRYRTSPPGPLKDDSTIVPK